MLPKAYDPKDTEDQPSLPAKRGATAGEPLPKTYAPIDVEDRIYRMWESSGAFEAHAKTDKKPFTISMPPPNATGQLHLGHAVMLALQDILIRFHRMRGKEALWVPGTDHAAIATENVMLKMLRQQGMIDPRKELGRAAFTRKIAEYVEQSRGVIRAQIRKMGSSCDWSRERYTLEPALNRCVNDVFAKMYADELIYRGHRIVNWDPKLQTTVSDDELLWEERIEPFYTFQYGPFQISTARPETKFGDKYVVMHPDDKRYARYKHGETFECEWINGPVRATIIKDEAVDPEFGTGVMTITPWHDGADFEIAERHGLEREQIIGFDGILLPIAGEFAGMDILKARPKIVEKLKGKGLLVKVDEGYVHRVAISQRGKGLIEPQIKLQWFIDVHRPAVTWKGRTMSLKEVMHDVVHHGDVKIIPERFSKIYFHWIDNLRDWCISRQIWWGHRVPVWYCIGDGACKLECKNPIVSVRQPTECPHCGSHNLEQDPDTLDTWFSSALWTWSTLVEPKVVSDPSVSFENMLKQSPDFQTFHPTSIMETGYDILFFWVARMILMTTYAVGQIPFKTVYLHGLVRTRDGKKMSKSDPETMIDPLDMIQKYGADALRLSMVLGQSPGNDTRLYEEKIAGYRNFVNKLWNAARFVLLECEKKDVNPSLVIQLPSLRSSDSARPGLPDYVVQAGDAVGRGIAATGAETLSMADRALLHALELLIEDVTAGLEAYRLSDVGERLYSFVWDYFCDWCLELSKGQANYAVLIHALRRILKLLHPYCPFVTEELWGFVKPKDSGSLIKEDWPTLKAERKDPQAFQHIQLVIDTITAIRKLRADQNVEAGKKVNVAIHSKKHAKLLESQRTHIGRLGKVEKLTIDAKPTKHKDAASAFLKDVEVHLLLAGLIDVEKEQASLEKEQERSKKYIATVERKLKDASFVAKAPASVVQAEKAKLADAEKKLEKVEERIRHLK